jgi:GT2 family glycosyltransferase
LLVQTLDHIRERTHTAYRLHVVDDGSSDDNSVYLYSEWKAGRLNSIALRRDRHGAMAAQNVGVWLAFSDPFVMTDDDVLCPALDPDWLARGLAAMREHKKLAMMCLHHPGAKYKPQGRNGRVVYAQSVGATFCFMRKPFVVQHPLPHSPDNHTGRPMERRCKMAHRNGWKIGYLHGVYCYHTGKHSQLTNGPYLGRTIEPKNWLTLEPVSGG